MKRALILADGEVYEGEAFGAPATKFGEIIFHTAMNGYQEIITNPIYTGQILVFTTPIIGAAGIHANRNESIKPTINGVIARSIAEVSINRQRRMNLDRFLQQYDIPGLFDIDTRKLARHLRETGPQKAAIFDYADEHAVSQLAATVLNNQQVANVSTPKAYANPGRGKHIVVIDFGLKHGILRKLSDYGVNVSILPYSASIDEVLTLDPDGIILSTGPGDPKVMPESVLTLIRVMQQKVPLYAIGLGHELFALANGAKINKMDSEHHGMNHPIEEIITGNKIFAMQGSGYTIDVDSIDKKKLLVTHIDLVDNSIQGLRHREFPAFSVQFFPDASPGPKEATNSFDDFMETVDQYIL